MPEVLQQMLNYVIAIYIRLSAEDGDLSDEKSESNSVVNQRAYIRRFIELRPEFAGAQILEFCDDGYSGTNMERPAVRRLLEQVRQRKINCIIVKDMSRFGRDYIVVGDYLEQIFPFLDVRFIAINDSYDSKDHKYGSAGLIDVSFRNVIYDLYSKDLSEKVRSTKKQLAEKGYCVAPYAFFGYQKAPGNKHTLLVDEDAAAVVRRVFDLFTSGLSTTDIARKFNTEGVLTPLQRKRLQAVSRKWNCVDQNKNYWTSSMVRKILDDERYTGKAIYGKTTQEVWDIVQRVRESKRRRTNMDEQNKYSGLVFCSDCGSNMVLHRAHTMSASYNHFTCRTYKKDGEACTGHYIRECVLDEIVLEDLRRVTSAAREHPEKFAAYIGSKQSTELQREIHKQEKELAAMRKRKAELDAIFKKLYEDSVLGRITTEQFQMLSGSYMEEQNQIAASIPQKEADIQRLRETVNGTDGFLDKAKRYTDITELTPELLRLFIEKIVVHEKEVKWSKHAPQTVEIYYNGIGYVGSGQQDVEETMEAPEPLQTQDTEKPRQAS